jgi:hypothetical protein
MLGCSVKSASFDGTGMSREISPDLFFTALLHIARHWMLWMASASQCVSFVQKVLDFVNSLCLRQHFLAQTFG